MREIIAHQLCQIVGPCNDDEPVVDCAERFVKGNNITPDPGVTRRVIEVKQHLAHLEKEKEKTMQSMTHLFGTDPDETAGRVDAHMKNLKCSDLYDMNSLYIDHCDVQEAMSFIVQTLLGTFKELSFGVNGKAQLQLYVASVWRVSTGYGERRGFNHAYDITPLLQSILCGKFDDDVAKQYPVAWQDGREYVAQFDFPKPKSDLDLDEYAEEILQNVKNCVDETFPTFLDNATEHSLVKFDYHLAPFFLELGIETDTDMQNYMKLHSITEDDIVELMKLVETASYQDVLNLIHSFDIRRSAFDTQIEAARVHKDLKVAQDTVASRIQFAVVRKKERTTRKAKDTLVKELESYKKKLQNYEKFHTNEIAIASNFIQHRFETAKKRLLKISDEDRKVLELQVDGLRTSANALYSQVSINENSDDMKTQLNSTTNLLQNFESALENAERAELIRAATEATVRATEATVRATEATARADEAAARLAVEALRGDAQTSALKDATVKNAVIEDTLTRNEARKDELEESLRVARERVRVERRAKAHLQDVVTEYEKQTKIQYQCFEQELKQVKGQNQKLLVAAVAAVLYLSTGSVSHAYAQSVCQMSSVCHVRPMPTAASAGLWADSSFDAGGAAGGSEVGRPPTQDRLPPAVDHNAGDKMAMVVFRVDALSTMAFQLAEPPPESAMSVDHIVQRTANVRARREEANRESPPFMQPPPNPTSSTSFQLAGPPPESAMSVDHIVQRTLNARARRDEVIRRSPLFMQPPPNPTSSTSFQLATYVPPLPNVAAVRAQNARLRQGQQIPDFFDQQDDGFTKRHSFDENYDFFARGSMTALGGLISVAYGFLQATSEAASNAAVHMSIGMMLRSGRHLAPVPVY